MSRTEDLFQKIEDKKLVPILSEYLIKHIGDDDYEWVSTSDYCKHYLATKCSKDFLINYHKGFFQYSQGLVIAPGRKKPGNEPFWIKISFPGELGNYDSHSKCTKGFWNGEQVVYEQYIPEQKLIVARVCIAKTVDEYSKLCGFTTDGKKLVPKKLHIYDIPDMMNRVTVDETITVTETNPCEFAAIVCDADNNQTSFYIEGESLYDAYYNLMVKKGYFSEDDQKTGHRTNSRG